MDNREASFVRNYHIFGEGTAKIYGFKQNEAQAIKEKYRKKGVFLLPERELAKNKLPVGKNNSKSIFGPIQFAVAALAPGDQERIIEIAKNLPKPADLMDQTIALQEYRVQLGLKNEFEQGKLLDTTEAAISNLVNMIQAKNTIEEGQDINLNVNSVSNLLDEIEEKEQNTDGDIIIDPTEEHKKQQLKEVRTQSINNILDEAKK